MKKNLPAFAGLVKMLMVLALMLNFSRFVSAQTPSYVQTFDNYFNNHLSTYQNKVVVVIGCPEGILYSYAHGYTAESIVSVQSISKWVTSAIIMMLVEENKFALDDKVGQYIPSWNANGKQNVTIRQILAHTSGIVDGTQWDSASNITLAQAVDNIATNTSLTNPGTFHYGSTSYKVASRVAEVVEGKPWKTIFSERLATVCGMGTSVYSPNSIDNPATGRGLWTSLTQYSNFLRMILRHGMHNSTRIMDSTSIVAIEAESSYDGVPFVTYGLGVWREQVDGNGVAKELMHPGVDGALAWVDRNKGYFGLIITSAGQGATYSTSQDFRTLARNEIPNNSCGSVTPPVNLQPCNYVDKQTVGTWSGLNVQTRKYTVNGVETWLIVTAVNGSSVDKHFPRGKNFADRGDISWSNGVINKSCLGGGETGYGGLVIPSNITVPAGYSQASEPDGAIYFQQTCTPPSAPSLSASPSTITTSGGSSTLTATGCTGGTITWSDGLGTGTSKTVTPTANKTYTASCSISGCTSSNASVTVNVNIPPPSGVNCNTLSSDVNGANCLFIEGWIFDSSNPNTPVNIDVYDGTTKIISNYPANKYRSDLSGMGNGYHAFEINTPSSLQDGQSHTLHFKASGCNYTLNSSPRSVSGCNNVVVDMTGADLVNQQLNMMVSPNPSKGIFETQFYLEKGKKATIIVMDLQGRIVYRQSVTGQGLHKERINLLNKASGTLFLQLHQANAVETKKINIAR